MIVAPDDGTADVGISPLTGRDAADIRREFPDLTPDDVTACLDYARDFAEFEAVPV